MAQTPNVFATSATPRRALISGIGVAGPALAYWLMRAGFQPTLVDHAPRLRGGGYLIDFWGTAYEVAERMGVLPALQQRAYEMQSLALVDADGRRVGGFTMTGARESLGSRYFSLPRGDLAAVLHGAVADRCECRFDDEIVALRDDGDTVHARLRSGVEQRYELVVGCDGLHSAVRRLAFGPLPDAVRPLGYGVAAFITSGYPRRDEGVYVSYTVPGRQAARYALREGRTAFLLLFECAPGSLPRHDLAAQKRSLEAVYRDAGWECPLILQHLGGADELYMDEVSQVHVDPWWKGRVALLGDSAFAPSLLAGQGAALAMLGAYVLGGELASSPDEPTAALARYDARLRPLIDRKQGNARHYGGWFAPHTRWGLAVRNAATHLLNIPGLAGWLLKKGLADDFALPAYPFGQVQAAQQREQHAAPA